MNYFHNKNDNKYSPNKYKMVFEWMNVVWIAWLNQLNTALHTNFNMLHIHLFIYSSNSTNVSCTRCTIVHLKKHISVWWYVFLLMKLWMRLSKWYFDANRNCNHMKLCGRNNLITEYKWMFKSWAGILQES